MSKTLHDYEYVGSCYNNPFPNLDELVAVIDNGMSISKRCFLEHCCVIKEIRSSMSEYPDDYTFFRSRWRGRWVYYYIESRIETFFMKGGMYWSTTHD